LGVICDEPRRAALADTDFASPKAADAMARAGMIGTPLRDSYPGLYVGSAIYTFAESRESLLAGYFGA